MTRPTEMQLAEFMRSVLRWLGQPRWDIILVDEPEEDAWASTAYNRQRYHVNLWISPYILNEASVEVAREVMVHEALHAIHVGIDRVMDSSEDYMHDHEHLRLFNDYHLQRELMVDQLGKALRETAEIKKLWRMCCAQPAAS